MLQFKGKFPAVPHSLLYALCQCLQRFEFGCGVFVYCPYTLHASLYEFVVCAVTHGARLCFFAP